jgi:hypothetical protein
MVAPAHYAGRWLGSARARPGLVLDRLPLLALALAFWLGGTVSSRPVSSLCLYLRCGNRVCLVASLELRGAAQLLRGGNGGVAPAPAPAPARPPCCPNSDGAVCSFVMLSFVLQTHWYVVLPRNKLWKAGKGPIRCPVHTFMLWPGRSSKYPPLRGKV